jgi:two-component system sensor histidine kinase CreC
LSLRTKVVLIITILFFGGSGWAYKWLYDNIRPQFLRLMEDGMVDHAYLLARQVEVQLPADKPFSKIKDLPLGKMLAHLRKVRLKAQIYERRKERVDLRVYITDHKGIVRFDSDNGRDLGKNYSEWRDVLLSLQDKYGARASTETNSKGERINSLYVSFPLKKKGRIIGVLSLVKSKRSLEAWAKRAHTRLFIAFLLAGLGLYLAALVLTQWTLTPILRLTRYAEDVAADRRVSAPPIGSDEIGTLTRAFVEMKTTLWARQDIEPFVTQLTHELKSPVSAIRGAAELLEDGDMPESTRQRFLLNIQEQSQRINDVIQRLLLLVNLENQEALTKHDDILVQELLGGLQERFLAHAHQNEVSLEAGVEGDGPKTLVGDRFLLEQALTNLIQNSFNFTPAGGSIKLTALYDEDKKSWRFEVTDTGPGIPEYALERATEKFYSLEHPRTGQKGTGLGLPFARQVALLHGGDFLLENRRIGGVCVKLWFPIVQG